MSATGITAARGTLAELEQIIERGLETFIEVGDALARIHDQRLYCESHSTFEDYCRDRWGFTRRRANQLVQAAQVGTMVPVENERQARELARLNGDEEQIIEAWREAQSEAEMLGTKITSKVIKNAVTKRLARTKREIQSAERTRSWKERPCDGCGRKPGDQNGFVVDGGGRTRCPKCHQERRRQDKLERKAWWDSLSETKREEHVEQAANSEAWHKLRGPLHAITGEQSIAGFLRNISEEIQTIEVWRQPQMLGELIVETTEIQKIAGDLSQWLCDAAQAAITTGEIVLPGETEATA